MSDLIPIERIENKILLIRGKKVLLDRDLAELYDVETSQLKRVVKRNIKRFPSDFMFVLNQEELENWRCQFGTSNDRMGLRYPPMALQNFSDGITGWT
jgi:ORF6N domain